MACLAVGTGGVLVPPVDHAWAAEDEVLVLDPVTVTARKRAESAADVPISLSVMDGDELDSAGIDTVFDTMKLVPNLSATTSGPSRFSTFIIRGGGAVPDPLQGPGGRHPAPVGGGLASGVGALGDFGRPGRRRPSCRSRRCWPVC